LTSRGIDMTLKLRAWYKKEKRMYVVLAIDFHFNHNITVSRGQSSGDVFEIPLKDVILLQSTGLKDKNSKEIWEGDIVKTPKWYWEEGLFVVKYDDSIPTGTIWCAFYPFNIIGESCEGQEILCPYNVEVIGNRFKNPELLKEDK